MAHQDGQQGTRGPLHLLNLEPIKQRLAASTPGTWEWPADHCDYFTLVIHCQDGTVRDVRFDYGDDDAAHTGDAEFVSHARMDIADLVAEVERLRSQLSSERTT